VQAVKQGHAADFKRSSSRTSESDKQASSSKSASKRPQERAGALPTVSEAEEGAQSKQSAVPHKENFLSGLLQCVAAGSCMRSRGCSSKLLPPCLPYVCALSACAGRWPRA